MNNSKQIKNNLIKELEKNSPDIGKVQKLTNQLSNLNPSLVSFSVDAGLIDRLGRELVTKKESAVSELVKNAYDADASKVDLIFDDTDVAGGRLLIRDDGIGMSREELINGFMRIASSNKIHNPMSTTYKRQRAGSKGIGRFAVQRLGHKATIITRKANQNKAIRLVINWDQFRNDLDLLSIRNEIEEITPIFDKGTKLIISNLRESWSEASIKRIYSHIIDLIQPFPLSNKRKALKNKQDPGFHANFFKLVDKKPVAMVDEDTFIFDYAVATIEAYVDKNGQGYYSVESNVLDIKDLDIKIGLQKNNPTIKFKELRNVHLKTYYFIYDTDYIPSRQLVSLRRLADKKGGIRLYRNGFRVLPYGEPNDDWLRLDYSVRRRQLLGPHGNNSFFGFIEINKDQANKFEESSSREGILGSDAFEELTNFAFRVVTAAVYKISEARGKKPSTSYKKQIGTENATKKLEKVVSKLEKVASEYSNPMSSKIIEEISEEIKESTKSIENELKEISLLRVLASLGLIIGEFTHEIRMYLNSLESSTIYLQEVTGDNPELSKIVREFRDNFRSLKSYASYFDSTIAENIKRELRPIEIRDVIKLFEHVSKPSMERAGIKLKDLEINGHNLFTVPMHISEWLSLIFNLYTNSKKAIKRADKKGSIYIRAGKTDQMIFIEFADNGDGIPEEYQDRIFDAFFTTTSPANPYTENEEDILGSGLGLKIVKDIVDSYQGNISIIKPPNGYSTCFRVEVPKATREELKKYEI